MTPWTTVFWLYSRVIVLTVNDFDEICFNLFFLVLQDGDDDEESDAGEMEMAAEEEDEGEGEDVEEYETVSF